MNYIKYENFINFYKHSNVNLTKQQQQFYYEQAHTNYQVIITKIFNIKKMLPKTKKDKLSKRRKTIQKLEQLMQYFILQTFFLF